MAHHCMVLKRREHIPLKKHVVSKGLPTKRNRGELDYQHLASTPTASKEPSKARKTQGAD